MKKILLVLFSVLSFVAYSQKVPQSLGNKNTDIKVAGGITIDSLLRIPQDTLASASDGSIAFKGANLYKKASGTWILVSANFLNGYALSLVGSTFSVDSATLAAYFIRLKDSTTYYPYKSNPKRYITSSDTAGMLLNYRHWVENYIKASDTAAAFANFVIGGLYGIKKVGRFLRADTTVLLTINNFYAKLDSALTDRIGDTLLRRLRDVNIDTTNLNNGDILKFNSVDQKWENEQRFTGTADEYYKGNGDLGTFYTDVTAIGDTSYADIDHTHLAQEITNLQPYVYNLFHAGSGLDYDPLTGTFSWPGTGDITSINGLTAPAQTIAVDSAANAFGVSSVGTEHTIQIPGNKWLTDTYVTSAPKMDSLWQRKGGDSTLVNVFDKSCGLIQPGYVVHDSLFQYSISPSVYVLCYDGVRRTTDQTQVTLSAADATYDRIDAIILDSTGVNVLTGTPSANPAAPQITDKQILLTYIIVPAGATEPDACDITDITVYDEDTEWEGTSVGTATFNDVAMPYRGTKDVAFSGVATALKFTGTPTQASSFSTLELHVVNSGRVGSFKPSVSVSWYNGSSLVSNTVVVSDGRYGFSRKTLDQYQTITIPISDFSLTDTPDAVEIDFFAFGGTSYLDYVRLSGACITQPTPAGSGGGVSGNDTAYVFMRQLDDTTVVFDHANRGILPDTLHIYGNVLAGSSSGFDNPMTTAGDLIIGGSGGTPTRLPIGSNNYVLGVQSGSLTYLNGSPWNGTVASGYIGSAAGAISSIVNVFNGSSNTTWTLPALSTNKNYLIKNVGTDTLTVQRAGSDNINDLAVSGFNVLPGESVWVYGGTTSWYTLFQGNASSVSSDSASLYVTWPLRMANDSTIEISQADATHDGYLDSLDYSHFNEAYTRINPRVGTTASSATITPSATSNDIYTVTALATDATLAAPTGTPVDGQTLLVRIKDDGTSRNLTWNAIYRASTDFSLPSSTTASKTMYVQFIYNSADSKWDAIGYTDGF